MDTQQFEEQHHL